MVGAANVVSGDDGDEGSGTVGTSGLDSTKRVRLHSGGRAVTVAFGLDTSIDTCGVTSPHLDVSIGDRLASRGVDDVDIQMGDRTLLASQKVLPDEFTSNP
jgi:hypothetical protein